MRGRHQLLVDRSDDVADLETDRGDRAVGGNLRDRYPAEAVGDLQLPAQFPALAPGLSATTEATSASLGMLGVKPEALAIDGEIFWIATPSQPQVTEPWDSISPTTYLPGWTG